MSNEQEAIGDAIKRMKLNEHPEIIKLNEEIEELKSMSTMSLDDTEYMAHYQKISDKYFQRRRTYERLAGWPLSSI